MLHKSECITKSEALILSGFHSLVSLCYLQVTCFYLYIYTNFKFGMQEVLLQHKHHLVPYHDPDYKKKLETTLRKAAAYLDKANASSW